MKARSDAILGPLRADIEKLSTNELVTAKNLDQLKDAVQSNQRFAASWREQKDKA